MGCTSAAQRNHQGQHHHQAKQKSEPKRSQTAAWCCIFTSLKLQEAQGAQQCPYILSSNEDTTWIITAFKCSSGCIEKAQNGHERSQPRCAQTLGAQICRVCVSTDTAKPNHSTGYQSLEPQNSAAQMPEATNTLPLENSSGTTAVCIDIHQSSSSSQP